MNQNHTNAQLPLKYGSLFSGIEGFGIAAHRAGWQPVFHCEINPFSQNVIKTRFPDAKIHNNITLTDFTIYHRCIDVLVGGFPCQPFSQAGLRKGTADHRNLWPEFRRAIHEIQPRWVVGENVPGIINWSEGLVFEQVQADLEAEGYQVQPFILPAAGVNAPHRRDRVWFVAYSQNLRDRRNAGTMGNKAAKSECENDGNEFNRCIKVITNSGLQRQLDTMGIKQLRKERITANSDRDGYQLPQPGEDRYTQRESITGCEKRQRIRHHAGRTCEPQNVANTESFGLQQPRDSWNRRAVFTDNNTQNVANTNCTGCQNRQLDGYKLPGSHTCGRNTTNHNTTAEECCNDSDTINARLQRCKFNESFNAKKGEKQSSGPVSELCENRNWFDFPTQSPVCGGDDGLSDRLVQYLRSCGTGILNEKEINQIVRQTIGTVRRESIKAYGNAIVPEVFYQIADSINQYEILNPTNPTY